MTWRVVGTDSEGLDGITTTCEAEPAHNSLDVMDCCAGSLVLRVVPSERYFHERMAIQLVAALNDLGLDGLEVCD